MAKEKISQWWIVSGIILFILLIGKSTFFGTLFTACENIEPESIAEFQAAVDALGGTLDNTEPFTITQPEGLKAFDTYAVNSPIGSIYLIDTADMLCNDFLMAVNEELGNLSAWTTIEQRQVLTTSQGEMWCNYRNNVALIASEAAIPLYVSQFEICTVTEVKDYVTDEGICMQSNGEFINGECICEDGIKLEIGNVCPEEQPRQITQATPTPTASPSAVQIPKAAATTDIYIKMAIILAVFLFTAYWLFEKGPKKGFIRRK